MCTRRIVSNSIYLLGDVFYALDFPFPFALSPWLLGPRTQRSHGPEVDSLRTPLAHTQAHPLTGNTNKNSNRKRYVRHMYEESPNLICRFSRQSDSALLAPGARRGKRSERQRSAAIVDLHLLNCTLSLSMLRYSIFVSNHEKAAKQENNSPAQKRAREREGRGSGNIERNQHQGIERKRRAIARS